jgi:uncharacterized protein YbjT (DUF2867 family)
MKIAVIGGTGLIDSKLVTKLSEQGHEAVAAFPNSGANTLTGEGLAEVLKGASVVVDVSNSPSWEDAAVLNFFETSTRNLLQYEVPAGVKHHVALSVVGTEQLSESGYFRAKIAQEKLVKNSTIPYTIVHATQFSEFLKGIADFSVVDGKAHIPPVLFQPRAGDDVASAVGRIAIVQPVNGTVEIGDRHSFAWMNWSGGAWPSSTILARSSPTPKGGTPVRESITERSSPAKTPDLAKRASKPGSLCPRRSWQQPLTSGTTNGGRFG